MCTDGCRTKDHASYAQCLRSKSPRVAYANSANGWDYSRQKAWDKELSLYRDLRSQGVEPDRCDSSAIADAIRKSDESGVAYDGMR